MWDDTVHRDTIGRKNTGDATMLVRTVPPSGLRSPGAGHTVHRDTISCDGTVMTPHLA